LQAYAHFEEQTQQYPWNREYKQLSKERAIGNILLSAHGTDLNIAEKIAQTGFASVSSNGTLLLFLIRFWNVSDFVYLPLFNVFFCTSWISTNVLDAGWYGRGI
jgi:hypothetical protein